ncbi:LEAF RUST 10 DISEASE-RESISTANCE LOCUS RECEPTOR-LIKE PROTEIN KINASE-like 1.1 isoform X1 [Rosa rugosa]|uniref:LEAF RUST 10 DISEASE-RESISTANCE LOCUS RECEPTOR-LIKE PROTEIN KINASE-like 1.1 isoform X1 n=1 Tax=Rosa rugosa TaxID=74645 RepID=UPI002B40837D|nr:LEAF RUST 10 DISEASE-RESISTANCE LOCUS RECEPTOR-LIKE PROTEIN KINASE-like 1.1 isoform X1 [Rosa rugosa]
MAPVALFMYSVLSHLLVLHYVEGMKKCPSYYCNEMVGYIHFPFKNSSHPPECGLYTVDCSNPSSPKIQLREGGYWHDFDSISQTNSVHINDKELVKPLPIDYCNDEILDDLSLPSPSPLFDLLFTNNLTLFKCNTSLKPHADLTFGCLNAKHTYYTLYNKSTPSPPPPCSITQIPTLSNQSTLLPLTTVFSLQVQVTRDCYQCYEKRKGRCLVVNGKFKCSKGGKTLGLKLGLGLGIGIGVAALLVGGLSILLGKKQKRVSLNFLSRNSNSDLEGDSAYFGVSVFAYSELDEATNHFDSKKELGDGGFGTVYHGKLKDGREVAVKRLHEHNYKREEQFMNEIEIITRLHHKNLVTLYGCTSRRSRELLLVYEYIPNGTVSDHLHGDLAHRGLLTWPIHMSIAIETANALSYLHASDILHRDVKTSNILLDNNLCVKVADFGLSRIFPLDITHVSTAPQGTPGYVDPQYHHCYQLTSKSDVYSFGVVLIELITSMPAVDITRQRDEINLSNLAVNKIRKGLYNELLDSSLGFESDNEVKRMTIAVAELAFQCLQQDNNMRPTICEVLETLKRIESINNVTESLRGAFEDAGIRSLQPPPSPKSATQ